MKAHPCGMSERFTHWLVTVYCISMCVLIFDKWAMLFRAHTPTQTHSQDESTSEEPAEAMGEKWPRKKFRLCNGFLPPSIQQRHDEHV